MGSNQVIAALRWDQWNAMECSTDEGMGLLRYRTPVPAQNEVKGYGRVLRIVWPYADEGSGAMPSPEESEAMAEFENRLCDAFDDPEWSYLRDTILAPVSQMTSKERRRVRGARA